MTISSQFPSAIGLVVLHEIHGLMCAHTMYVPGIYIRVGHTQECRGVTFRNVVISISVSWDHSDSDYDVHVCAYEESGTNSHVALSS